MKTFYWSDFLHEYKSRINSVGVVLSVVKIRLKDIMNLHVHCLTKSFRLKIIIMPVMRYLKEAIIDVNALDKRAKKVSEVLFIFQRREKYKQHFLLWR